jgi:hypothetical protein
MVEHAHLCPSVVHLNDWPAAEATVTGTYAEQPRLGGTHRRFCQRCADLLEDLGIFTPDHSS